MKRKRERTWEIISTKQGRNPKREKLREIRKGRRERNQVSEEREREREVKHTLLHVNSYLIELAHCWSPRQLEVFYNFDSSKCSVSNHLWI